MEEADGSPENGHGALTAPQAELLTAAVEEEYFDVPRRVTMADLAAKFDISNQAASERPRRGLSNALRNGVLSHPNVL
ncbi:helix-turn-helix domain-containing protein [Halococcus sp. AFM35]|uniref:helix-turn-helix domain-containing protein n=1 Tax=Halococcus sp. AFM35 TaxID=3421653 RepID=UPI003EB84009